MADTPPQVSVIIVNWNGCHHLPACLDSLAAQSFRDFEVILVDNGSTDGSVELVRERYPWVRLVELAVNSGFATGNNCGLEHARGEYLVTLNNDTMVAADWLEILAGAATTCPRAGMVGSRICSFEDPDIIDSIGVSICRDGMSRGRFRRRRWSSLQLGELEPVLLPSACAALYKRAMLDETGFFDDDFFAYAEDSDLGLRGRLAGWDAIVATRAVVCHKYSQTSGGFSPFKVHLVERNHYWLAVKTFPFTHLLALPLFTVLRYLEQFRQVLSGQGAGREFLEHRQARTAIIAALLKGFVAGWAGVPHMFVKRRKIMAARKISMTEMAALLRRHRLSFKELLAND